MANTRTEQKRLARAVALTDDVPELVGYASESPQLEAQLIAAKRPPEDLAKLVTQVESSARSKLADLRSALSDRREFPAPERADVRARPHAKGPRKV